MRATLDNIIFLGLVSARMGNEGKQYFATRFCELVRRVARVGLALVWATLGSIILLRRVSAGMRHGDVSNTSRHDFEN